MRLGHVSEIYPTLPRYHFFETGNTYTGSKGDMRYRIKPGEKLVLDIWHGDYCFEKSEIEAEKEFENSEEGFSEMLAFMEEFYNSDDKAHHTKWENYTGWSQEQVDHYQNLVSEKRENGDFT